MHRTYCVYIMASASGTLYIGSTSDIVKRAWEHKTGALDGFSKRYGCTRLVYYERFDDPRDMVNRERELKRWTRARKVALIEAENPRWQDLAETWGCPMALPNESMADVDARLVRQGSPVETAGRKGGGGRGR